MLVYEIELTMLVILPILLVDWDDSPVSAPTQQSDAARYAAWWMSG